MNLRVDQQVIARQRMLRGNISKIRTGTILAFKDNGNTAVVSFPAESKKEEIPVSKLESVKSAFGRDRVVLNPTHRHVGRMA